MGERSIRFLKRPCARRAAVALLISTTLLGVALMAVGCEQKTVAPSSAPSVRSTTEPGTEKTVDTYEVVHEWPHDRSAFTQGLLFHDGQLYESTGIVGLSTLRKVDPETGKIAARVHIDEPYFAEGIAIQGGKLYQLTWTSQKGFIYDVKTLSKTGEFTYRGEGWGLTSDGKSLIVSNGSESIQIFEPGKPETVRTIKVTSKGRPLRNLNELEYIRGEIYANIWHANRIVRIDPVSGKILGWIDLEGLVPPEMRTDKENTLNGIAYDADSDRLFVTGKRWPNVFEIRVKRP